MNRFKCIAFSQCTVGQFNMQICGFLCLASQPISMRGKKKSESKQTAKQIKGNLLVNIPWKVLSRPVTQVKAVWTVQMKGKRWNGAGYQQHSDFAVSAMIDSTWCGHSRPLQSRTEIAGMLQVLNKCRRVKGSAVTGAGKRQGQQSDWKCQGRYYWTQAYSSNAT